MSSAKLAEIITRFSADYSAKYPFRPEQQQVVTCIKRCRTEALGGGIYLRCNQCGRDTTQYHSCRNRHCPQCQQQASQIWLEKRLQDLLPVRYFHLVFTLPHVLNTWVRLNPRVLYKLLFQSVWQTLNAFGHDPKRLGGQLGATMVLHTWGQKLDQHVHLHCLVPAGVWCKEEGKWHSAKSDYLFPVKALSRVYRGKMVSSLRLARTDGLLPEIASASEVNRTLTDVMKVNWVVYTKTCHGKPERVLRYLSRYTYRIAISENRISSVSDEGVRFRWKDYRDNRQKTMLLSGVEFLRRFVQHVLPKGFMRIRHYGFLSNAQRRNKLESIKVALAMEGSAEGAYADKPPQGIRSGDPKETLVLRYCSHCHSQNVQWLPWPEAFRRCKKKDE